MKYLYTLLLLCSFIIANAHAEETTTINAAMTAEITTSTAYSETYDGYKAADGIKNVDPVKSWGSLELNPWIKFEWSNPINIQTICLNDRLYHLSDANSCTLTFSDGSVMNVNGIPTNGADLLVDVNKSGITSMTLQVTGGTGENVGFAEIAIGAIVSSSVKRDIAPAATITASSIADGKGPENVTIGGPYDTDLSWNSLEKDPWINFEWKTEQKISAITVRDRAWVGNNAIQATAKFSDGSTELITFIDGFGEPKTITFPEKAVKSVRLEIIGDNDPFTGLAEVRILGRSAPNATATSSFSHMPLKKRVNTHTGFSHHSKYWEEAWKPIDDNAPFKPFMSSIDEGEYKSTWKGDFNGDGLTDFVHVPCFTATEPKGVVHNTDRLCAWLALARGDGTFNFKPLNNYDVFNQLVLERVWYNPYEFQIRVGDFNGDGRDDIIRISPWANKSFIALSNDSEAFTIKSISSENPSPQKVYDGSPDPDEYHNLLLPGHDQNLTVCDMNGDGIDDLVHHSMFLPPIFRMLDYLTYRGYSYADPRSAKAHTHGGTSSWVMTFDSNADFTMSHPFQFDAEVAINYDTLPRFLMDRSRGGAVSWAEQWETKWHWWELRYELRYLPTNPLSTVLLIDAVNNSVVTSFVQDEVVYLNFGGHKDGKYEVGDFNGDGMPDFLHFNLGSNGTWFLMPGGYDWKNTNDWSTIFLSQEDGSYKLTHFLPDDKLIYIDKNNRDIKVADFNNDGDDDILHFHNSADSKYSWIGYSNGDGTFDWKHILPSATLENKAFMNQTNYQIVTGDFNGDGNTDILHQEPWHESQYSWIGYGKGGKEGFTFSNTDLPGSSVATNSYINHWHYKAPLTGDFDGDGRTDLAHFHPNHENQYSWVALNKDITRAKSVMPSCLVSGANTNLLWCLLALFVALLTIPRLRKKNMIQT
jgi:hypothetical protein